MRCSLAGIQAVGVYCTGRVLRTTLVRHAYTHSSAFEKISNGIHLLIALSFQIITFLRFGCILACVLAGTVGPIPSRESVKVIRTKGLELGTSGLMHPAPTHFLSTPACLIDHLFDQSKPFHSLLSLIV